MNNVLEFDKTHLWHPYTSITDPLSVVEVVSAEGVRLKLADGRSLIDGMSSWWAVIHGYRHPRLINAIQEQAEKLCHVMFGGITHEPAVELAAKLIALTPAGLDRVFLCDSGSVAVEVAMKMAMQFFYARGDGKKKKFLTIKCGYHGDTFHAMSVCDPETGMHHIYSGVLPQYYFAESPKIAFHNTWDESDLDSFRDLINRYHEDICGVILEPIVQGAGGMRFYHPSYLKGVRQLCDQYDILLIADEIATGFGRSGELFGCTHAEIVPDIMCLGKALTGGYLSLAAVLATSHVGEVISSGEPYVFMHGPTFMANPLACKVASTSLSLLEEMDWKGSVLKIQQDLVHGLAPCRDFNNVVDVRVLGAIGVVELDSPVEMKTIQKQFVEEGVWLRPFGKLVYIMPPFCIKSDDTHTLTKAVVKVLSRH